MAKRKYSRKKIRKSKMYKKRKYSRKQKGGFLGKLFGNFTSIFSSIVGVSKKLDNTPIETPALSLMLSKCNDANKELTNLIAKLKELQKQNDQPPNQNNQKKLSNNNAISKNSNSNGSLNQPPPSNSLNEIAASNSLNEPAPSNSLNQPTPSPPPSNSLNEPTPSPSNTLNQPPPPQVEGPPGKINSFNNGMSSNSNSNSNSNSSSA
jgi:hypothetical protein